MDAINRVLTAAFDVLLGPLEDLGDEAALLTCSALFGVLALFVFKHISAQGAIRRTKDRIKGHLIEIRLYQDNLGLVSRAIARVLGRNVQYLALNLLPFIPLSVPFAFVAAQMVVRYGFEPVAVRQADGLECAGDGSTLWIEGSEAAIRGLGVTLPEGFVAVSALARVPSQGVAAMEFAPARAGAHELVITPGGGASPVAKAMVVGPRTPHRAIQGQRVTGLLAALLWPAEDSLAGTGLTRVEFRYPESDLGWLPFSGPAGVLINFLLASMLAGLLCLKPLGVVI